MRLAGALAAVAVAAMAGAGQASAACPITGCPGGGGIVTGAGHVQVIKQVATGLATVSPSALPTVIDNRPTHSITCGEDCDGAYSWSCVDSDCAYTPITLSAVSTGGWEVASYTGCDTSPSTTCSIVEPSNPSTNPQSVTVRFNDVQAPSVSLVAPPAAGTHVRSLSLVATSSDNDKVYDLKFYARQGASTVYDGLAMSNPSGVVPHAFSFSGLADGVYEFGAEARDYAARISRAEVTLVLDRTTNTPALGSVPASQAWLDSTTATLDWTGTDADATTSCKVAYPGGHNTFSACTSPWTATGLAEGTNDLIVRATDGAGNTADVTRTVNVDSIAPTVTAAGTTPTAAPSFALTVDGTGSTASATCWVDSAAATPCAGTFAPTGVSDGDHVLHVHVTDQAGNAADATRDFTVDTVPPSLSVISGPSEGVALTAGALTYAFDSSAGSALSCSLDSEVAFRACSSTAQDALGGVADGLHTWRVRAVDAAGNTTVVARTFTVDTVAPTVTVTGGPPEGSTLEAASATFGFTPEAGAAVACSIDSDAAFHPCAGTDVVSGLGAGGHVWRVRVSDAAGNVTIASRSFTVVLPAAVPPGVGAAGGAGAGAAGGAGGAGPPVVTRKLTAKLTASWSVHGSSTRVRTLKTNKLPAGTKVTVACKGRGCPFKKRTFKPGKKGVVDLRRAFAKALHPGMKLTVALTRPGYTGRTYAFTVRKGRKPARAIT